MNISNNPSSESSGFWDRNKAALPSPGDVSTEVSLESVKERLRRDYRFALFSILPGMCPRLNDLRRAAKKIGLPDEDSALYADQLVQVGLWEVEGDQVRTRFEYLDLGDISVKDYLAMTVSIVSHLSETKSYAYDTLSLVTNRPLVRNFVGKVNQALRELHEKSQDPAQEKSTLFSWTHTGVIEIENKKISRSNKDTEQ